MAPFVEQNMCQKIHVKYQWDICRRPPLMPALEWRPSSTRAALLINILKFNKKNAQPHVRARVPGSTQCFCFVTHACRAGLRRQAKNAVFARRSQHVKRSFTCCMVLEAKRIRLILGGAFFQTLMGIVISRYATLPDGAYPPEAYREAFMLAAGGLPAGIALFSFFREKPAE
jgi:hypothetical protein